MNSCDTLALGKAYFSEGKNFLGKNSDRPLGEAQPLVFYESRNYEKGEMLHCTHLSVPQAEHTYAVLGSRPYWIWGFEMGLNECGLIIGNEAQGSRCEAETEEGLLGMDMLRLALERAKTAREGIDVIASFLKEYGQNANASMLFDRRYENSYLLVDKEEIWLMETAGRQWVAKYIPDWTAISNCYTIGEDFDICSSDMETYARERRWIGDDQKIDFAKTYTLPAPRQSQSVPRWRRLRKLIEGYHGTLDADAVKTILRDHFEGELIEPRYGGCYGGFVSICMHAMTWDATQTAASLLSFWHDQLGPICWYAPSLPCCSVYIPVYWTGEVPEAMSCAGEKYSSDSLWWTVERLAMAVSADEERFGPRVRKALKMLERSFELNAAEAEKQAVVFMEKGEKEQAKKLLSDLTVQAVYDVMHLANDLAMEISEAVMNAGGLYGPRKEFLEAYAERVDMPLF